MAILSIFVILRPTPLNNAHESKLHHSYYWDTPKQEVDSVDKDFRIHNGRVLSGLLSWKEEASKGTINKRDKIIRLRKSYRLGWRNYSNIENRNGRFRYLTVKVADE